VAIEDYQKEAVRLIVEATGLHQRDVNALLAVPPSQELGDFAFPCFSLAKQSRRSPVDLSAELASKIKSRCLLIDSVKNVGPYLNFWVDRQRFTQDVLNEVSSQAERFGSSQQGHGKTVCIDYSSPNIAKPFHVGHLRTTIIGACLYRVYQKLGYHVVGINHLGDWGTQFGKMMVAIRLYGKPTDVYDLDALNTLYVRFHAEETPEMTAMARNCFHRLEKGDPEVKAIWHAIRETSLAYYKKVYARLGVHFDSFAGESFYNDKMATIINEAHSKKILKTSDGALIVDLENEGISTPALLGKTDGATLYLTRDIAAAVYRKKTYGFHKMLYVVGAEQNLHFQQLIACLKRLGNQWAEECIHVNFGKVPGLSTREGNAIDLEAVFDEAAKRILEYIRLNEENRPKIEDPEYVAEQVGKAAIFYSFLSRQRAKDYPFDWDRVCSFDGDTGPYLINAYARIAGIIRKCGVKFNPAANAKLLVEPEAQNLVTLISKFPATIQSITLDHDPHLLTKYLLELARGVHTGYRSLRVKGETQDLAESRLLLLFAAKTTLGEGMRLLGITPLDKM
jgi:arginyl-tRNA synthetase